MGKVTIATKWCYLEIHRNFEKFKKDVSKSNQEMGKYRMAISNSVQETKVKGIVSKDYLVVLSQEYNGIKTIKIPYGLKSKFANDDEVIVTFANNLVINVETVSDYLTNSTEEIVEKLNTPIFEIDEPSLLIDGYYISEEQNEILEAVSKSNVSVAISLIGESGYGKTTIAEFYSKRYNKPILIIDCSTISDNQEWFVIPEFKDATTSFSLTKLSEFLIKGDCVIVFDEINRMPSWVSNALLPILDHRKHTHLRGVDIKCGNNITFFFTSNHGAEYTGTNPLDKALLGRVFGTLIVDSIPEKAEIELLTSRFEINKKMSSRIVKIMNQLRKSLKEYPVNTSTRTSLYLAYWINMGLSLESAVKTVILNVSPDEAKKIIAETIKLN